jgi:hypothetical protein
VAIEVFRSFEHFTADRTLRSVGVMVRWTYQVNVPGRQAALLNVARVQAGAPYDDDDGEHDQGGKDDHEDHAAGLYAATTLTDDGLAHPGRPVGRGVSRTDG